ncbi:MAG TPA: hypothetical protein VFZ08_15220 [Terriglobia bacterium]|nr:hypothetical protein [Terriglobia bacterium]
MAYVDPKSVVTPRTRVKRVDVLYNSQSGRSGGWSWSVALLDFDDKERIGIRWNGSEDEEGKGNPQSHGRPTWFVVPDELADLLRDHVEHMANSQGGGLLSGYREMANDRERESEAEEWCEGLIGDATRQAR